ncbi:MFS general substrate transporter [Macroventuria anomochaeta]|uniref:MFS general substrate transporter n=1 Tax=Macroventuria anomochaeta TaxID=301207 RepID=A0ACB6RPL3_9PLEO|nr:MFS general substrate transporter [Macroventuria anomochaeta]KAF2622854.1 MFS general substrate transporter [Macroventuria anomochaeta]
MAMPPVDSPGESNEEEGLPFLDQNPIPEKTKPWVIMVILAFVLVAIIDMGAFLAEAPRTRVYEANICLGYYRESDPSVIGADGSIPEKLCKVDAVQQKMAMIFGWQEMFDVIPSIFLAIPFGALADKVGRKWIFTASLMGLQLNSAWVLGICYLKDLPLQLTWLSSAFYFIGGGPIVAAAIGITMISDIAPPEKRTTIFLYLTASVLIAEIVAPIMSARLMESGDWYPLVLALIFQQAGVLLAIFFPETLHLREKSKHDESNTRDVQLQVKGGFFSPKQQLQHFQSAFQFLKSNRTLALVVFTFMANRLGRQGMTLLVRYASKRYDWEIKQAAYLLSFRAATNLVAVALFLPLTNYVLLKHVRLPTYWADLWIARGSILLTSISFLVIGLAAHPALLVIGLLIYNLGTGYNAAMRSVSIHVVGGQSSPDIGKLMSTIAIVESLGALVAGPLLNQLFQWGMSLGSVWLGLPFLTGMLVFAGLSVVIFKIDVGDKEVAYTEVQSEVEDEVFELQGRASTSALEHDGSTSTVHRHAPPIVEPLDPGVAQQHAIAAATAAFARSQAQGSTDRKANRSIELVRSKSTTSRKSLTSQGSHFPPRELNVRSVPPQKSIQTTSTHRLSVASAPNTEKFPSFNPTPGSDRPTSSTRPLSAQPSVTFSEYGRPASQPKSHRQSAASSITSQQIRKARSMYYASSVQTGSPIARPPAKYLTTPPPISPGPALSTAPTAYIPTRSTGPSPLAVPRVPVAVAPDETIDSARDKYLQDFQQRSIKHKPSLFLAPFKKRQDKSKDKAKRLSSIIASGPSTSYHFADDTAGDITVSDFMPQSDAKDRRSFSGSLKRKIKRVFRRTSNKSPRLPVQQIEASREYFGTTDTTVSNTGNHGDIPSPDEELLQRVRSQTLTQRAIKRLTVIHEAKDSIGSITDRSASALTKRKLLPIPALSAFKDPMHMESLAEEASTPPVDPKRVFSALMREIDASKSAERSADQSDRTPGAESDVFESSKTKELHSTVRELHSSASRDFDLPEITEQKVPARRPASVAARSVQSKKSSIKSFGQAIRSTIRTVTPSERRSSPCPDQPVSEQANTNTPSSGASSKSPSDRDNRTVIFKGLRISKKKLISAPTAEQIEMRVAKAKTRWQTPLNESATPQFPRETDRLYTAVNFAQQQPPDQANATCEPPASPQSPTVQSSKAMQTPMSPSVYSRNTDGVSILPNDSVMSFNSSYEHERTHHGGSAVILTSQSVRSYVIGTPSPNRPHSTRSSRDWKAWLSHEVSGIETTSQEDITIQGQYATPSGRHKQTNSSRSRLSKSPTSSVGSSLKSPKTTPGPKVIYSDISAPATSSTTANVPSTALRRAEIPQKSKENITPPSMDCHKRPNTSLLGLVSRPKSLQPLSSAILNRSSTNMTQYAVNVAEGGQSKRASSPAETVVARPSLRVTIRPLSPEKLSRRPRSAFDLRNTPSPRLASELRRPALHPKTSSRLLAHRNGSISSVEASSHEIGETDQRDGSATPGQRMAERFLKERKSATVLERGVRRSPGKFVREDTPAFL